MKDSAKSILQFRCLRGTYGEANSASPHLRRIDIDHQIEKLRQDMAEAMQIYVHGFYEEERIEAITQYLLRIGFIVNDSLPIDCNDVGGLIETDITDVELVSEVDPCKILLELRRRTACDGIWIDVRKFRLDEEKRYGQDPSA